MEPELRTFASLLGKLQAGGSPWDLRWELERFHQAGKAIALRVEALAEKHTVRGDAAQELALLLSLVLAQAVLSLVHIGGASAGALLALDPQGRPQLSASSSPAGLAPAEVEALLAWALASLRAVTHMLQQARLPRLAQGMLLEAVDLGVLPNLAEFFSEQRGRAAPLAAAAAGLQEQLLALLRALVSLAGQLEKLGGRVPLAQQQGAEAAASEAALAAVRRCANMACDNLAGASDAQLPTKRCSRCRLARYGSEACSAADWRRHRAICRLHGTAAAEE
ncbi:hypothetical protein ABPG75_011114 [Micractinium tetrahymenae]